MFSSESFLFSLEFLNVYVFLTNDVMTQEQKCVFFTVQVALDLFLFAINWLSSNNVRSIL